MIRFVMVMILCVWMVAVHKRTEVCALCSFSYQSIYRLPDIYFLSFVALATDVETRDGILYPLTLEIEVFGRGG